MNIIAWILTITGSIAFLIAAIGIVYVLTKPDGSISYSETSLHDTYYIIAQSKTVIWPLLLCMALSAAITIIGFSRTDQHLNRVFSQVVKQSKSK